MPEEAGVISQDEKQKDPYYFTFFNEGNDKKEEEGDESPK